MGVEVAKGVVVVVGRVTQDMRMEGITNSRRDPTNLDKETLHTPQIQNVHDCAMICKLISAAHFHSNSNIPLYVYFSIDRLHHILLTEYHCCVYEIANAQNWMEIIYEICINHN